ncbi:MAG TPA: hypothetical protein V6D06_06160 [Trichocoleus sp.]
MAITRLPLRALFCLRQQGVGITRVLALWRAGYWSSDYRPPRVKAVGQMA